MGELGIPNESIRENNTLTGEVQEFCLFSTVYLFFFTLIGWAIEEEWEVLPLLRFT